MAKNLDIQDYGLNAEIYSVTVQHNTQFTIPTGPVTFKSPIGIAVLNAALGPGESITGYSWDTSSGSPRITVQFSGNVTRDITLAVLYRN